jgi:hypothetical protein
MEDAQEYLYVPVWLHSYFGGRDHRRHLDSVYMASCAPNAYNRT